MRPPYREAAAMLAAAGHSVVINLYAPTVPSPDKVRYALLRDPRRSDQRPTIFETLGDLCDSIDQRRKGRGIDMEDTAIRLYGEAKPRPGVSIWTLDELGQDRDRFLGWAYLHSSGRDVLKAAMPPELATYWRAA